MTSSGDVLSSQTKGVPRRKQGSRL